MKSIVLFLAILFLNLCGAFLVCSATAQTYNGFGERETIDRMRERNMQPEKIMDAIKLEQGMKVGGTEDIKGYFAFKISKRIGNQGILFVNDRDSDALSIINVKCARENVTNVRSVLGVDDDPLFPDKNLDMVVVFDCFYEFSQPLKWMQNTRKYLKPGGKLVIVDPDPSKIGSFGDFMLREQVLYLARKSGYTPVEVDDSFLKNHMIIVLKPVVQSYHQFAGLSK